MRDWLQLLRPALAPTAAADVIAGAALGGGASWANVALGASGSALLYMGGMAQNDLLDRKRDPALFPQRPLSRRPEMARAVPLLVLLLFACGLALHAAAGTFSWAAAVAGAASAYNLGLKRLPGVDALAMGGARALNLAAGFALAGAVPAGPPFAYLAYIAGVTLMSRAEDAASARVRRILLIAGMVLQAGAIGHLAEGWWAAVAVGVAAAPAAALLRDPRRDRLQAHVFRCLVGIYVVHAAALASRALYVVLVPVASCAALTAAIRLAGARPAPAGR